MRKTTVYLLSAAALVIVMLVTGAATPKKHGLRLMYWNIQNGMWADQGHGYDQFVSYVKSKSPDICVWCEAQSIYISDTQTKLRPEDRYLTDHWDELAARYGHKYVFVGGHRDNYPQVITSRYPIREMERITGAEPDSVVSHGAGWARINVSGRDINLVTLHTYPQKWRFHCPEEERKASAEACEGDAYRAMEVRYICEHTILNQDNPDKDLWLMCGDFNSKSRSDNHFYGFPDDAPLWQCQDWIHANTPYIDVIAEKYPGKFCTTNGLGTGRPDYVFVTRPLYDMITSASVINDRWTLPKRSSSVKTFFTPSDHRPIIIDFDL